MITAYVIKRGDVYFKEWVFRGGAKPSLKRWSNIGPIIFYADDGDQEELARLTTVATNLGGTLIAKETQ